MMKTCSNIFAAILFSSTSASALAAAASPEEAARLVGVFQTYLGREAGVVAVTPAGEAYDVKIDFAPLIAKVTVPGFSVEGSSIEMKLTQQGGGKWLLSQDSPLSYYVTMPGGLKIVVRIGNLKSNSIFDQNLAAFVSSTSDVSDFSIDETIMMPDARSVNVAYVIKSAHYETVMKPVGLGKFDGTTRSEMIGLVEKFSVPPSPGVPAPDVIVVTANMVEQEGTLKGVRMQAAAQLFAWFVAHPSFDTIRTEQAELKTLTRNSLPLFENFSATSTVQSLSAKTPVGPVSIANLGVNISMNGIVANGMLHERLYIVGFRLPLGFISSWAAELIPETLVLDFTISDFNLADPSQIILDNIDLVVKPPPNPELEAKLLTALLPKGTVEISIGPSKVTGKLYDLDFEGAMTAGPVGVPLGAATIKAKGLDEVLKALQTAPPEMGGQAIPAVIAAKGMAKTESGGTLSWRVENTISGTVLINGIDVSKMGGGG